ncbi:G-type lectin S-receptor-like serine/threonine-protein kinase [Cardamine amara subsp. amara]|uniref:G-type lectin S-receptor-like serine/threonine-protein kinase n=1 Tax=Cardamine amara subsp. amara TaxID=228776 RepID=A0ABD1B2M7_CARAN
METCKKNMLFMYFGVLLFLSFQVSYVSSVTDTISINQTLSVSQTIVSGGDTIVSSGDIFELGLFNPTPGAIGFLYIGMWYKQISPRTIVWVANRESPVRSEKRSFEL